MRNTKPTFHNAEKEKKKKKGRTGKKKPTPDAFPWKIIPRTPTALVKQKKKQVSYRHIRSRPRQPKEPTENAKGALRYSAETETWQCAQCDQQFAAQAARGAESHVATHTRRNRKQRLQSEQVALEQHASRRTDAARPRTLLQYGDE